VAEPGTDTVSIAVLSRGLGYLVVSCHSVVLAVAAPFMKGFEEQIDWFAFRPEVPEKFPRIPDWSDSLLAHQFLNRGIAAAGIWQGRHV
jgi:hypothetical protein